MTVAIGVIALAIALASLYLGRRDLTRPVVVFGVVWFGVVALAQLQLSHAESDWSVQFAALVFGGGLAFMAAAVAAGGWGPARDALTLDRSLYNTGRLIAAALLLIAGAIGGWVYKAHLLGGIPLLSDSIDVVRARAFAVPGHQGVPAWASALTGGFYVALWILLAALWLEWGSSSRVRKTVVIVLAAGALFGVALDASRNLVLMALSVPLVAAYVMSRPRGRRVALFRTGLAVAAFALVVGGGFVARLSQTADTSQANVFLEQVKDRNPAVLSPLLPVYVNGVLPLDGYWSLYRSVPRRVPWGRGAYSLLSLPDAAFPRGKPDLGQSVAFQLERHTGVGFWTVSTYQGRAFGDFGALGVIALSVLFGLLFGGLYRLARNAGGLAALVVIGYVVYYTGYMAYDNLLSFTLISIYDLAVVSAVARLARSDFGIATREATTTTA